MTIHESLDDAGVLELVMDNPPVNSLGIDDTYRLAGILDDVRYRLEVKAVILTATGKGFCAGVDIKEMQQLPGNEGILGANRSCYELFRAVYDCAVPVVTAVQDFCLGTGIGIAGNSDVLLAAEGVAFGLPEVDNGALGAATHLSRLVPQQRARQMLYTCEPAPAEELAEYGSIYRVVPADELLDATRAVATTIAEKNGLVMRRAKESMNGIDPIDVKRSYRYEQGFTFELNLHGEGDRARDAFLAGERNTGEVGE